jgi:chemotaxis protein histidine kinase CheA
MDKQLGMAEFFAMEAGEYLERLDALVSTPGNPNGEEFQRLTRALRGAALMANQQAIAGVAGAFEQVARAVREGRRPWDESIRQLAIRAVDDLKLYVRRVREWADDDTARARDLAAQLEAVGGKAPHAAARSHGAGPDAGTRAFVAREAAALASALARAAGALQRSATNREPLQAVTHVMQPLRGLASLGEFPPLPDLLDGIDRAATAINRLPELPSGAAEVLDSGAKALTQATREIATAGRADAESVEIRRFTEGLRALLGLDEPAVPIEALYPDDAGAHLVERQPATEPAVELGRVELVALGEHLKQVASGIEQAATATQQQLRALALADTLRTLERGAGPHLRSAAAAFARAGRDAITHDAPLRDAAGFAGVLRQAGTALAAGEGPALAALAEQMHTLALPQPPAAAPAEAVGVGLEVEPEQPPAPAPAPSAAPEARAAPSAARPPAPERAPEPPPAAAAAATAPAAEPHDPSEPPDLAGTLIRYRRYLETLGLGTPSLEELLAGPPADPRRAAAAAASAAPTAPPAAAPAVAAPRDTVPSEPAIAITDLCYSGPAALERALDLRTQVEALLAAGAPAGQVRDLVEEVFDLVQLGLGPVR